MPACLFCRIVQGSEPSHVVWEDERHLAFLTIFPNTLGVTVVVTKEHFGSYAFALPDDVLAGLTLAAAVVARKIDRAFEGVGRTALVFEGFGVDHVHAKLFPMHGTAMEDWRPILSQHEAYTDVYEGFVTTHDGPRADDQWLAQVAERIRRS